tara:strand:+ start:2058 stop:3437 length:1380 start_codon:yes stop_codon:yes gene_type:complete
MAINPFLSFATGALRRREDIRDERAEAAGELLDVVSDYYFTQTFPAEEAAIKNDNELYKSVATEYNDQVAEGLNKMGYISAAKGDLARLKDLINNLEKNKPGFIKQLQTAEPGSVMYGTLFADRNDEKKRNLKDNKDLVASVLQDKPELAKLNFGDNLKTNKIGTVQNLLFGTKLDKTMAPKIIGALDTKMEEQEMPAEGEASLSERIDYKPPLPGSRVETKYAQINKAVMDKNPSYGKAVATGVAGEFDFNLAGDYDDQYKIHTIIAENIEKGPEGSGQNQGVIATISGRQLQDEVIKPAVILNLGDDNYKKDFIFQSGLTTYINLNKAIKANNENPLKNKFLNDFKLSDTTKGFIAGTIKSVDDSQLPLYEIDKSEKDIFSGDLKNVSNNEFAAAYATTLIITADRIHQKHGPEASSFFFQSIPEIQYKQANGKIANIKSLAMLEFNKLKNKSLNNR